MKETSMQDAMQTAYKLKDISTLERLKLNYPSYARKAQCYIDRINKKKGAANHEH